MFVLPDAADLRSCIQRVPILRVLPDEGIDRLQGTLRHRHLQAGETLIGAGESIRSLIVVARGAFKVSRVHPNGREQVVRELRHGDFYGELALFSDVVSDADVVAEESSIACMLERDALKQELQQSPKVAWSLVEVLANRLLAAERAISDLALLDVGQRLASALLQLGNVDREGSDKVEFSLPYTWAEFATRIATTPESLSRRLRTLSELGLVETDGRRVSILDPEGLREVRDTP